MMRRRLPDAGLKRCYINIFSAREDADTAMLTFLPGRGNLCDIVRGKRYGGVCRDNDKGA